MVNSIKNIVNRVEVPKSRELDSKSGSGAPDSSKIATALVIQSRLARLHHRSRCPSFRPVHQLTMKL